MIELRVLTAGDWPIWRELRLAALAQAPYAFGSVLSDWQGDGDREERWRAPLEIPGSFNVVAMLDGKLAGMVRGVAVAECPAGDGLAGAGAAAESAVELHSMWVSPLARGRGVGDRLIGIVQDWAKARGAAQLRLCVMPGNEHALALYQRHGLRVTGEPGDLLPDGVTREIVMAKLI